ncbi:MAG: xylulokinase [Gaiellaceae bacterium]|nr:xylulokinase [Gaiellaceae bacterium]
MRALGLDIGLSGVRATIVDDAGGLLATASAGDPATIAHGRASHDPRLWRSAAFSAARAALDRAGPVDVIGIGALGSAPFLVDADGEPVGEALLFSLDSRSEADRAELGLTGDHALPKVRWLAARNPRGIRATDACGWIVEQLTGRPTMDAITRLAWTPEIDLPLPIPDPVDPLSHAPLTTDQLGLPRGTPVVAGTFDSYVDVYAAGCRAPGDGCVLLGSTLVVYGVVADEIEVAGLELQAYPGDGYLLGGATSSGGNVIAWARRTFGDEIASGPIADGLRVLPYLAGERTPVRDAAATGAVLGITLTTTPAELHRAFVDGIALAALDHAERIATAVTVGRWRVSGGGVRNASWLAATADALGVPLEVAPLAGEGAGPALFALAAMGVDPPPGRASLIEPDAAATSWYRDALAPYRARHPHLRGAP